jgi:DNA-binding transcriptional LysR family regulator
VPSDHPLADQASITLDDVLLHPFILREQGSGTRQVMEEELRRVGYGTDRLKIVMELGSTGAIKSAVEAGLGITLLSPTAVRHETALGIFKVKSIEGLTFTRHFYSIYLQAALLPISAVTFLTFLRERDLKAWL